ncbi:3-oxoacyl-[acyl-carrier-protein] synthase III C-terminal domain-containing protein [Streptomyces sp. NPDC005438]|uniref:3-oxoacyl-[acyl-carrier-protein] synthase III C-terminal domain-containing protein n=1 Tax=Streptomyces sp. NPDC005438 TaxID=3156880 RepID=UPI0033B918E2
MTVTEPIGLGPIHCLLPGELVPTGDLPEAPDLDTAGRDFLSGCGIDTVGVIEESAGALAARATTEFVHTHPGDVDVLLHVGARAPDVLLGSDVCRAQAEAGLTNAFSFTVDGLGCTGSSAAWGLAADLLRADPGRQRVLITHASRPTGVDRVRPPVTVTGDGAYAMTVERAGSPLLRAHRVETDGTFHDLFRVDYKDSPWYEWREECTSPDRYRFELAMHSNRRLGRLVEEVLADAGAPRSAVATVLMQNVTASAFDFYEELLQLPVHPVCRDNLARYGHLGAMDVVLNLRDLLDRNEVAPGGLVLVLNNSPVAAWAATLWEV